MVQYSCTLQRGFSEAFEKPSSSVLQAPHVGWEIPTVAEQGVYTNAEDLEAQRLCKPIIAPMQWS